MEGPKLQMDVYGSWLWLGAEELEEMYMAERG